MSDICTIRRGTPDDAPIITQHRRLMFEAMGFTDPAQLDAMGQAFDPWVRARLASGEYIAWLVVNEDDFAVTGLCLQIEEFAPHPADMSGKRGYIFNVYTFPEYRGRGFATQLTITALEWCRDNGINRATLKYSDAGRPIYEKLGFKRDNGMSISTKNIPVREQKRL